jgi:hypothetical protein
MEEDIYKTAVKLDFKEPKVWDELSIMLVFGNCAYSTQVENGEVVVRLVQPYTEEFDKIMFGDFDKDRYVVSEDIILSHSDIMEMYNLALKNK